MRFRAAGRLHDALDYRALCNGDGLAGNRAGYLCGIGDLDLAPGDDVALDRPGDDNGISLDDTFPESTFGKRDRAVDIAFTVDLAIYHEMAPAPDEAFDFAAIADQGSRSARRVPQAALC